MELYRLSDKIWYSEYDTDRDRPALGYIRGDDFSVAIDAGHSDAHVNEFYDALKEHGLPLPSLTVITHWHWDHSFGMHAIHGLSVANRKTNEYLKDFIAKRSEENDRKFLELDPSIALEYKDDRPIVVKEADIIFEDRLHLNAGNTQIELFQAPSSHTSDSTLILLPEEKVLFFGDALSGVSRPGSPIRTFRNSSSIRSNPWMWNGVSADIGLSLRRKNCCTNSIITEIKIDLTDKTKRRLFR